MDDDFIQALVDEGFADDVDEARAALVDMGELPADYTPQRTDAEGGDE